MNIKKLVKDFISMIWNNLIFILTSAVAVAVLFQAAAFLLSRENIVQEVDESDQSEESPTIQVGEMEIYYNKDTQDISVQPYLIYSLIEEIESWNNFGGDFALNQNQDSTLGFREFDRTRQDQYNPVQNFLGLQGRSREQFMYGEDDNLFVTMEVDQETGEMNVVRSHFGITDFIVDLNLNQDLEVINTDEEEASEDDLLYADFRMNTQEDVFISLDTRYNWRYRSVYPRVFNQNRRFEVMRPQLYQLGVENFYSSVTSGRGALIQSVVTSLIAGIIISTVIVFVWNLINKTINYSFVYGWASEDLFLHYGKNDGPRHVAFDMLQSANGPIVVLSEHDLSSELTKELNEYSSNLIRVKEVSDLSVGSIYQEFVLVVQRKRTTKDWYRRQRKHLDAIRDRKIKIVELD